MALVVSRLLDLLVHLFNEAVPPTRRCASAFPFVGLALPQKSGGRLTQRTARRNPLCR